MSSGDEMLQQSISRTECWCQSQPFLLRPVNSFTVYSVSCLRINASQACWNCAWVSAFMRTVLSNRVIGLVTALQQIYARSLAAIQYPWRVTSRVSNLHSTFLKHIFPAGWSPSPRFNIKWLLLHFAAIRCPFIMSYVNGYSRRPQYSNVGYGQNYGQNYGRDYGQNYGRDYGQNYGRDYGQNYGTGHDPHYQNYNYQQPGVYPPRRRNSYNNYPASQVIYSNGMPQYVTGGRDYYRSHHGYSRHGPNVVMAGNRNLGHQATPYVSTSTSTRYRAEGHRGQSVPVVVRIRTNTRSEISSFIFISGWSSLSRRRHPFIHPHSATIWPGATAL